jgi:hypothetical protein
VLDSVVTLLTTRFIVTEFYFLLTERIYVCFFMVVRTNSDHYLLLPSRSACVWCVVVTASLTVVQVLVSVAVPWAMLSHRPFTAESRVHSQVSPCEMWGGHEMALSGYVDFPLWVLYHQCYFLIFICSWEPSTGRALSEIEQQWIAKCLHFCSLWWWKSRNMCVSSRRNVSLVLITTRRRDKGMKDKVHSRTGREGP